MKSGQYESLMTIIRPTLHPVSHILASGSFELNAGHSFRTSVIVGARLVITVCGDSGEEERGGSLCLSEIYVFIYLCV